MSSQIYDKKVKIKRMNKGNHFCFSLQIFGLSQYSRHTNRVSRHLTFPSISFLLDCVRSLWVSCFWYTVAYVFQLSPCCRQVDFHVLLSHFPRSSLPVSALSFPLISLSHQPRNVQLAARELPPPSASLRLPVGLCRGPRRPLLRSHVVFGG